MVGRKDIQFHSELSAIPSSSLKTPKISLLDLSGAPLAQVRLGVGAGATQVVRGDAVGQRLVAVPLLVRRRSRLVYQVTVVREAGPVTCCTPCPPACLITRL